MGWNTVEKRVMEFANSSMGELTVAGFEAFAQGLEEERVRDCCPLALGGWLGACLKKLCAAVVLQLLLRP